MDLAPLLLLS
jgi:hypothetical protein